MGSETTERAVLAGGCFWGMEDLLRRYKGAISSRVGYNGGNGFDQFHNRTLDLWDQVVTIVISSKKSHPVVTAVNGSTTSVSKTGSDSYVGGGNIALEVRPATGERSFAAGVEK